MILAAFIFRCLQTGRDRQEVHTHQEASVVMAKKRDPIIIDDQDGAGGSNKKPKSDYIDYSNLFMENIYSDVKLIVGAPPTTTSIPAHRNVLAQRSSYFKAMFEGSMVESTAQEVTIQEVDHFCFRVLIDFIYKGQWPDDRMAPEQALFLLHSITRFGVELPHRSSLINWFKAGLKVRNVFALLAEAKVMGSDDVMQ